MRLGIDASNLRMGGGVTHLVEVLRAARPPEFGFDHVVVWGSSSTLSRLQARPWLEKESVPLLERSLPIRLYWQHVLLSRLARKRACDLLFVPGGSYLGSFRPFVTMCRNMLPFEFSEAMRYGPSRMLLRTALLRLSQVRSFGSADGTIFLTRHAHDVVRARVRRMAGAATIISHGVDSRFSLSPRRPRDLRCCTVNDPLRVLYVSIVDVYKHQWHVAEAIGRLRSEGMPIALDLIGPAYPPALRRLKASLRALGPLGESVRYLGSVEHSNLPQHYQAADLFVFASSCENLPNVLLEAMAAGLPIACSRRGPMPEVLADAGVYFDPEDPDEIAGAIRDLAVDVEGRARRAKFAHTRSKTHTWDRCAALTFDFLRQVAGGHPKLGASLDQSLVPEATH